MDFSQDAARLALLAARAGLSRQTKIRRPDFLVPSVHQRLTAEQMVERLIGVAKPALCVAREVGGSIEITCTPLQPGSHELRWHQQCLAMDEENGGSMGYVRRVGGAEPTVYCVGWDESLLLSASAVEKWRRDYAVGASVRGDTVHNPLCNDWPDYQEAKAKGAEGILIFSSP